jgi:Domain of unknown function (DUF4412)
LLSVDLQPPVWTGEESGMRKVGMLCALALGTVAAPAAAQGSFEGKVVYHVTMANGDTTTMTYYQMGEKIRQEMEMEEMQATSIYDASTGESIMLIPRTKQYMVMNFKKMGEAMGGMSQPMPGSRAQLTADLTEMRVTPTGKKETVAGITCEHYLFEAKDPKPEDQPVDICGAPKMGFTGFVGGPGGGPMIPDTRTLLKAADPDLKKLAANGFFTLKVSLGTDDLHMEATEVDRGPVDAALFRPPADYKKMGMPGGGDPLRR